LGEAGGDDREAGPVQSVVDGELGDDVLAVTALLDHPQDAAEQEQAQEPALA
jgi:hypothetical protein